MKIIIYLFGGVLIFCMLFMSFIMYRRDPSYIRKVYLTNYKDYFLGALMLLGVFLSILILLKIGIPKILTLSLFSLFNLFGDNGSGITDGTNLNLALFSYDSAVVVTSFWIVLLLCLPYLALLEEKKYRSNYFGTKERIYQSIKFGFVHMIVGIPLFAAIILCFVGWIFSVKYVKGFNAVYNREDSLDLDIKMLKSEENGINESTSLHAKYNLILITLVYVLALLGLT